MGRSSDWDARIKQWLICSKQIETLDYSQPEMAEKKIIRSLLALFETVFYLEVREVFCRNPYRGCLGCVVINVRLFR
jgi:hypothetical protein